MAVTDTKFNPSGSEAVNAIKTMGVEMERTIMDNAPAGRRRAIALTHLETALMFAVKSAAVGDDE